MSMHPHNYARRRDESRRLECGNTWTYKVGRSATTCAVDNVRPRRHGERRRHLPGGGRNPSPQQGPRTAVLDTLLDGGLIAVRADNKPRGGGADHPSAPGSLLPPVEGGLGHARADAGRARTNRSAGTIRISRKRLIPLHPAPQYPEA